MSHPTLNAADLRQFTGSETVYRHNMNRNVVYTEGIQYLAEHAGAYWLVDKIAILQLFTTTLQHEEFQVWTLTVDLDHTTATLTCDDGNDNILHTEAIAFTDFPLPSVTLYFANNTLLLPSEY